MAICVCPVWLTQMPSSFAFSRVRCLKGSNSIVPPGWPKPAVITRPPFRTRVRHSAKTSARPTAS